MHSTVLMLIPYPHQLTINLNSIAYLLDIAIKTINSTFTISNDNQSFPCRIFSCPDHETFLLSMQYQKYTNDSIIVHHYWIIHQLTTVGDDPTSLVMTSALLKLCGSVWSTWKEWDVYTSEWENTHIWTCQIIMNKWLVFVNKMSLWIHLYEYLYFNWCDFQTFTIISWCHWWYNLWNINIMIWQVIIHKSQ